MKQYRPNRQDFGGTISIICAYIHIHLFTTFRVYSLGISFLICVKQVCKQFHLYPVVLHPAQVASSGRPAESIGGIPIDQQSNNSFINQEDRAYENQSTARRFRINLWWRQGGHDPFLQIA